MMRKFELMNGVDEINGVKLNKVRLAKFRMEVEKPKF